MEERRRSRRTMQIQPNCLKGPTFSAKTFESVNVLISSGTMSARLVVIYGPPSKFNQAAKLLPGEFFSLLESVDLDNSNLFIAGDLTSTWKPHHAVGLELPRWRTYWLPTALSNMCTVQLRRVATLWTSSLECLRPSHPVCGCAIRDSRTIRWLRAACTFSKPPAVRKQVSVRNYRSVNIDSLCRDLTTCLELHSLPENLETAAQQYMTLLSVPFWIMMPLRKRKPSQSELMLCVSTTISTRPGGSGDSLREGGVRVGCRSTIKSTATSVRQ